MQVPQHVARPLPNAKRTLQLHDYPGAAPYNQPQLTPICSQLCYATHTTQSTTHNNTQTTTRLRLHNRATGCEGTCYNQHRIRACKPSARNLSTRPKRWHCVSVNMENDARTFPGGASETAGGAVRCREFRQRDGPGVRLPRRICWQHHVVRFECGRPNPYGIYIYFLDFLDFCDFLDF